MRRSSQCFSFLAATVLSLQSTRSIILFSLWRWSLIVRSSSETIQVGLVLSVIVVTDAGNAPPPNSLLASGYGMWQRAKAQACSF
mmetsp:Transcript_42187/g.98976  ORF Transcript_42187/g.98976 Transcript_42187/m.98976 type:complete len:85 (+) Transcript_42187:197-451(+)